MENAWQMKCAPTLLSSSSSSSVAPSVQVQRQDSRNQMEMNLGYYMHGQDMWRARSVTPAMTQTANYSDLSNLVSYSSGPTGIETSFHAQPSLPIQCNKKHLSDTVLFRGRNHPSYQGSAILYASTSKDMKDPSLLETGNQGRSPGAEMQSFFPSRALAGANNTTGIAVGDDLNAARAFISNARNASQNGGCLGPVRASYYSTSHGTDNCTLHKVHSKVASNVSCRPSTVINGSPRVFCMNKCGNLLLSNMGLLGIVCSCHGQNMSIAKFCEHSGISDVNPGDAVRMDSGESIAQWRSLYFQKFGIRAKEDDRGWDWPEEFTTAGATKCSTGVTAGAYDSVLSDLHLVTSKNLLDNVSGRISHSGRNYANKMLQNDQLANGLDQKAPSHRRLRISSSSNASAVVNVQPCNFPGHLTVSRANDPGLSCWPWLSSVGRSAVSTTVSSSLSTFEKLGNLGSEIQNHSKDNNFLDRGTLSSGIELKLGQPSQQASGSTSLPVFGCQITDLQNILSSELLNRNHRPEFISKYIECSGQYNLCNTASYSSSSRMQCHFGPVDHVRKIGSENDVNNLECLKDKSIKSSMISKPHSCTVLNESVQHKEINKPVNDVNQPIPWILHSHSHMGKSEPSVIPARQASQGHVPQIPQINGCDGTVRPPGTAKWEVQKNAAGTVEAWKGCKDSSSRTESSFQIYAKQMENSGFFTRSMSDTFYPRGPVSHAKKLNSFQLSSRPLDNFRKYTVLGCDSPISSSTCYGHGKMTSAQASTLGSFSEAAASTAVSKQNLVQVNKDGAGRPHLLSESLRMIASKKRSDSFRIGDVDASFGLHQQPTILSSLPELRMKRSPPDALIQEGQMSGLDFTTPCNVSEHVAASVLPGVAPRMGVDREKLVMLVGSNNPEDAAICARGIPSHAEERDTIHQGSVAPVPIKHSSMGIGSKMTSLEVYNQYYPEGSDRFMSGSGNLVGSSRCLYIQNDSLVSSVNGSVQKVSFCGDNASNSCTPRFDKDPVPVECKGKMHGQITENLNFQCPEWRKVSPKANGILKLSDDTNLTARPDKSGEGETHTEPSAIRIYDQVTGSNEGKGESDLSSGCSGAAVSELSDGMNKIDSCTVHDGDIGNADDQVVDQPCLIDKSCSSDDDLKSQESADFPSSTAFTKEKHLKLLPISTSHNFADRLEQKDTARLERTNSQSHCLEAHDKFANFTKFANGLNSGKKKHRRKWMSLGASFAASNTSLSHSTSPSYSGKAVDHQHCNSKGVSTLVLPDQSSSHMHGDYSMNGSCKRKRSALPLSRKLPRRRDLQKIYDTAKSGHYRQKLEGNATFVDTLEVTTAKRLKQNKLPELPLRKPYCQAAEGNLQHSLVGCMKPCRSSKTSVLKKMTKPIVCGMYGIISGQDGLMKCPRIVPLSQVLEKAENCSEIENHDSKAILMRELRDGFSGWKGKPSRDFAVPSIEEKYLGDLTKRNNNTCYSEDDNSSDEEFTLDKVVGNRCKRNMGNSRSCRTISLNSKGRKVRKRSLYEFQGVGDKMIGLNARNMLHATNQTCDSKRYFADSVNEEKEGTCARTEGYKGRKQDSEKLYSAFPAKGREKCLVSEEQLNAWFYISRKKWRMKGQLKPSGSLKSSGSDVEQDCKKEYAQFKQAKHWKHLMVYKSRIHALGLYTSVFISRGTMVVEYIGEIVGPRIADKRENDYLSGRGVQYKSACYFFRIDKEHIIDATRKGGIARFVNHSCRPNCVAKIITVKNEKKVVFFAERDIYPGEEITYDYHFNNEDEGKKIACFCRSSNCRRYLN